MNKWVVLVIVLAFLLAIGILASNFESLPIGQVVAALASVTVAAVGLFVFFKKSKH